MATPSRPTALIPSPVVGIDRDDVARDLRVAAQQRDRSAGADAGIGEMPMQIVHAADDGAAEADDDVPGPQSRLFRRASRLAGLDEHAGFLAQPVVPNELARQPRGLTADSQNA